MNRALNQVESTELELPAIQWSAASWIGARSAQVAGCGGTAGVACAVVGTSPATSAATAVMSLYLMSTFLRQTATNVYSCLHQGNMSVQIHRVSAESIIAGTRA